MKKDYTGHTIGFITDSQHSHEVYDYIFDKFEEEVDQYANQVNSLKAQYKFVRRYLFIKLVCLPIELCLGFLLLGRFEVKARLGISKKLFKAFKNVENLTVQELNELYELC